MIHLQRKLPNGKWKYVRKYKRTFKNTGFIADCARLEAQGMEWRTVRNGVVTNTSK